MKHLLFYFVLFLSGAASAQTYYNKTYNIEYYDHPFTVTYDTLDNVIVCGWTKDENLEKTSAFALKVNASGEELWRITLADTSRYYDLCVNLSSI